ncbi:hypothetical protein M758_1G199900 [Ceratodon purpureus]|nr:hypothetical protein M758_1G199900 [Ceratodon purpureus]
MKIKYTQRSGKKGRAQYVDTDFALAIALQDDDDSDDDFQPGFLNQALALRTCAVAKDVKTQKVARRSLKLGRKQGGGGGEVGDAVRLEDGGEGDVKVCCDDVVVESTVGSVGLKERKESEKRVLTDHNSKSTGRSKSTGAVVVLDGDENGNNVRSGKVEKGLRASGLEEIDRVESTDWRIVSSLAGDPCELQEQSGNVLRYDSKRKIESSVHDIGWSDGVKKVKTVGEDVGTGRLEQTDVSVEVDSLSFDGDGDVMIDLGAEDDEEMIICTQIEAPVELEFGQSEKGQSGVVVDAGKKTAEGRPKSKFNIYDIVLGNHRKERVPIYVSNPTVDKVVECEGDVEELDSPGTAMRALVDEAELDYEALVSDEEENESMDPFECPLSGNPTHLDDLSVSGREQHVSDCLLEDNVPCGSGGFLVREVDNTEAAESVQQLSGQQPVTIETVDCPICGVCIEELSTAQREEHTNACLEKENMPCVRTSSGDFEGCQPESTELETTETIVCPICGDCIEELSTAQREVHTNACLDNSKEEGPGEVAETAAPEVAQALDRPDVGPVVKWLTNLNLGKYVDIFVKEEIDWATLKWLTEEDLSSLGITALGPRRKIVCAIQELRNPAPTAQRIAAMQESQRLSASVVVSSVDTLQGSKKSISDFFVPRNTGPRVPAPVSNTVAGPKAPVTTSISGGSASNRVQRGPITAGGNLRSAGTSGIPTWMCIPGTSFRVDAFKYTTGNCSNWFLTHFHSDHYQGLTRGFRYGKILCSSITARLVNLRIGVPLDRIQVLPLNETVLVDGVRVTFIDANHCPGSVMILFEPPNGKAVLHTGDFRFCSDMTCHEVLKACRITTLILDTTYCDPQYDFPLQDSVIQFVIDAIEAEAFNAKTLFLIGTYTIGKERIFLEVGKALKKYVYVGKAKQRLLDCMDLAEEDKRWLTTKDQQSHIHVVPLWSVASFKRMGSISRHYHGRYNSIVAFSPTGWSFGKDKKRLQGRPGRRYQQGSIIRYEVPYSEHSSFTELKEFVRTVAPENIVPSVISSAGLTADAMVASLLSEDS